MTPVVPPMAAGSGASSAFGRHLRLLAIAIALTVATPLGHAVADQLAIAQFTTQVRAQLLAGQTDAARAAFNAASTTANNPADRALLTLSYADALVARAKLSPTADSARLLSEAAGHYADTLTNLPDQSRPSAYNNYGTVLLRQGNPDAALKAFDAGTAAAQRVDDRKGLSRLQFNAAALLERSEKYDEALTRYERAFEADSTFTPPAEAGLRLAATQSTSPSSVGVTAQLLDRVVSAGNLDLADAAIRKAFAQAEWRSQPAFVGIVNAWIAYLVAAQVAPSTFARTWQPLVKDLAGPGEDAVGGRIHLVLSAFAGELPVTFDSDEARVRLTPWLWREDPSSAQLISAVLKSVGDGFTMANNPQPAFAAYIDAFALDTGNVSAALFAANLLLEESAAVDPERQLLERFISQLFESKQTAYLTGDWINVLRLHTILGTIYSRQEQW